MSRVTDKGDGMAEKKALEKLTSDERMKRDYDEAKRRRESQGMTQLFVTPEEGDNIYRILSEWKADETFYRKVSVHYGVYTKNEKLGIPCPKQNGYSDECPACDIADALFKKAGKDDIQKARRFMAKDQYYVNVLVVETPSGEREGEVRVWRFGNQVFTQLIELMMSKWGKITDALKGRAVTVKRTGMGQTDTEYNIIPEPEPHPVKADILKQLHDLDDDAGVIETFTPDEIEALMEGEELDDIRGRRDGGQAGAEPTRLTKDQLKRLRAFCTAYDIDVTGDADILERVKAETAGQKAKPYGDWITLLEELGVTVDGRVLSWPAAAPVARRQRPAPEPEPDPEAAGIMPILSKTQRRRIKEFASEYNIELSEEEAAWWGQVRDMTTGLKSKPFGEWAKFLEELGADVRGKTITWPEEEPAESQAEVTGTEGLESDTDEDDHIKQQMDELRRNRAAKAKGKGKK